MKTNIQKIQELKTASRKLANLRSSYLEKVEAPSCDKYNMEFGGDSRFSVFSCKVFLDCHTGYYGNSGCSTLASVDSSLASELLNKAMNKHMNLILATMAEMATKKASTLTKDAEKEIASYQKIIDAMKEPVEAIESQ